MDKFKTFMGLRDDEYIDDEDYDETDDARDEDESDDIRFEDEFNDIARTVREETPRYAETPKPEPRRQEPVKQETRRQEPVKPESASKLPGAEKVVSLHDGSAVQVVVVKPERFEDAGTVADHLKATCTVILNLEDTNRDIARRLVDFLSGVAYANGGHVRRVTSGTYIITPYNVSVTGDPVVDELESSGALL